MPEGRAPRDPFACHTEDDRIFCRDCRALYTARDGDRFCRVTEEAGKGRHQPQLELPHRCAFFFPRQGVTDQRHGRERWPELVGQPGGPDRIPYPDRSKEQQPTQRRAKGATTQTGAFHATNDSKR